MRLCASSGCRAGTVTMSVSLQTGMVVMPSPTSSDCANPTSYRSSCSPLICCDSGTSKNRSSTSGSSCRHSASKAGKRDGVMPSDNATRNCPWKPWAAAFTLSRACSKTVNTRRTCSKNSFPARVSRVLRVVRANSTTPSSSSSSLIARDSGDCSMCSFSAARAKWSSSATARKQRRCRSSISPLPYPVGRIAAVFPIMRADQFHNQQQLICALGVRANEARHFVTPPSDSCVLPMALLTIT
ncbi:hypothetical protein V561_03825 [Pseudomonas aeruginosa BWH060]|nr:hypothetical protein V561_03825 [Pseudomonas aeruginosa BWH060]